MADKPFLSLSGLSEVWAAIKSKFQEKLVSGTNIKTINNSSILGSGNINITSGVSGVKGDAESSYRTGQVNLTKANLGLGNVENKSSATIRSEIEIGGRNLFPKSYYHKSRLAFFDSAISGFGYLLPTRPASGGDIVAQSLPIPPNNFKLGEQYTVSFYVSATGDTNLNFDMYPDNYSATDANWTVNTTVKKITHTFIFDNRITPISNLITPYYIRFWRLSGSPNYAISIWDIKIEKGNKATDWTPAPEDVLNHRQLTQSQYDALPSAEKNDGTVYFITDGTAEDVLVNDSVPIGAIQAYAGTTAPTGWIMCNGQAVSRSSYSELFNVVGTTYGSGDGSTTFNVPDLRGRVITGVGTADGVSDTVQPNTVVTNYIIKAKDFRLGNSRFETVYQTAVATAEEELGGDLENLFDSKFETSFAEAAEILINQTIYSTTEKRIGTWIDGKPLYRKVLTGTSTSGQYGISVSSLSIDTPVKIDVSIKNTTGGDWVCGSYVQTSGSDSLNIYMTGNRSTVYFRAGSGYAYGAYRLMIEYTKTTDTV